MLPRIIAAPAHSLTVGEGFADPLGFHQAVPDFSWKLPAGVEKQTAYRIQTKSGPATWDSGWVESGQSTFVHYGGEPFVSRQRVEWRVAFKDDHGKESEWSEPARFELGLLSASEWTAQWIRPQDPAARDTGSLRLIRAIYRSREKPDIGSDVTERLRNLIHGPRLAIRVTNGMMDGDPAPDQPKELVATYIDHGKETTVTIPENGAGIIPPANPIERVGTLRRAFQIDRPVANARAYVTARGLFELRINGTRVGNDHFANGFTSYNKRLDSLTYDVTRLLKDGGNTMQSMLACGWYAGRFTFENNRRNIYGGHPGLLLQLEITYQDGTRETVVSDGKWQGTFDGPVVESSIYDGEIHDARKSCDGWTPVETDANLGPARIIPKPFPPVRETRTLGTTRITEPQPGKFVFDLGQNMVGWARIRVPVEADHTITLRFAEMLQQDGTLYNANYRGAKSIDTYTAAEDGVIDWQPHFTFHGFRYVELTGLPPGTAPEKDWVTGVVLHSGLTPVGAFTSSHEKLNQLQSNIVWGWRGNSLDIPTDCPQRNERLGWTGDAEVFAPTAMFNYDCLAFWKSWLGSMRDDQFPDGRIPHVVPDMLSHQAGDSPGWMDAATIIPWEVYIRTGDISLLADNYPMMERLVAWYRSQSVNGLTPKIAGFGDWLQPGAKTEQGDTARPFIACAYYAHSTRLLAKAARVLGHDADFKRYDAEAAGVREAFTAFYFDSEGRMSNPAAPETQTGYVLALAFELLPRGLRPKAAEHLVRLVGEAGGHLRTGFLGTPYLTRVLDDNGHPDVASGILFKETYPSWFYPINQGATTMWERWNSYTRDKGFGDVRMNSFNHYAYGAIGQWMYERIAGLAPDPACPGYKHFFVRPLVVRQLNSARAQLETAYGPSASGWKRANGQIEITADVPPNATATVELPDGRRETVGTGVHRFRVADPVHP